MKEIQTEKGFIILEFTSEEAYKKGFGMEGGIICCQCNGISFGDDKIYFIGALDDFMDEDCYKEWYKNATYYPQDKEYELESIAYAKSKTPSPYDHKIIIY